MRTQIGRPFEIVGRLLDKKKVMAGYFGVWVRTIYRNVEALAQAGIPIYASKQG